MKVSELSAILSRLDDNGEIGIERSRQTEIPGVIEVELYELGIKKHVLPGASGGPSSDTYLLYATTKATHAAGGDEPAAGSSVFGTPGSSRRRPVIDTRPLVAASRDDGS